MVHYDLSAGFFEHHEVEKAKGFKGSDEKLLSTGFCEPFEFIEIDVKDLVDIEKYWQQKSFDKQFVRDYLESLDWDKTPPAPELPPEIIKKTREKYLEAYNILTR